MASVAPLPAFPPSAVSSSWQARGRRDGVLLSTVITAERRAWTPPADCCRGASCGTQVTCGPRAGAARQSWALVVSGVFTVHHPPLTAVW